MFQLLEERILNVFIFSYFGQFLFATVSIVIAVLSSELSSEPSSCSAYNGGGGEGGRGGGDGGGMGDKNRIIHHNKNSTCCIFLNSWVSFRFSRS